MAFCIDNMNVGGTELNAVRTAPHLLAAGVELSVFSLSEGGALLERYARLGVPVDCLPIRSLYGRSALVAGRQMYRLIRQRGIQIVHAQDLYSNIFAGPWTRLTGAAFIASRRWWKGSDRLTQRLSNRLAYLLADQILANSPRVARFLTENEWVPPTRVTVVPNFVDREIFQPPPETWGADLASALGLPARRQVVGTVANLSPVKDHATLLRAVATLAPSRPDLHVVLVGADGGSREALEHQAKVLGIDGRVRFAGNLPQVPSPHYFFDISVLTSRSEGFPNSVLEAMAAGRPVVSTAVGAIPDAIRHGTTGLLVEAGDWSALAGKLAVLLNCPGLRHRLGTVARQVAENEYTAAAALEPLLQCYHAVRPGSASA